MKSYHISHGYGILLVNQGTSFSSGFFFMIGLTPEICWTGRTFTYRVMIVSVQIVLWKKPLSTYSGIVPLLRFLGFHMPFEEKRPLAPRRHIGH
jgi:hypothetical protein